MTNTDATSYKNQSSAKVIERATKAKKDKHLEACLAPQGSFMLLVYLLDGTACKEAKSYKKRIALLYAQKWERPYSKMVWHVRGRMSM